MTNLSKLLKEAIKFAIRFIAKTIVIIVWVVFLLILIPGALIVFLLSWAFDEDLNYMQGELKSFLKVPLDVVGLKHWWV